MRLLLSFLLMLPAVVSAAPDNWLTILGDPMRPEVNTIQFDPASITRGERLRTMAIRVNRNEERVSTDGIRFRSFSGIVEFDCSRLTARFAVSQFYDDPLWQAPGRLMTYAAVDVRPMAFRDFEPNPRDRIIQAACGRSSAANANGSAIVR